MASRRWESGRFEASYVKTRRWQMDDSVSMPARLSAASPPDSSICAATDEQGRSGLVK